MISYLHIFSNQIYVFDFIWFDVCSPSIGHFTQVVQDNALEVGCGLIVWHEKHKGKHEQASYFVCNYAMGNMEDQPIYVPGSTAALCVTGNNPIYEGLCSIDEVVNVKSVSSSN